jgi:hypothetical protein
MTNHTMTHAPKILTTALVLNAFIAVSAYNVIAAPLRTSGPPKPILAAPTIASIKRAKRTDGVWHDVIVTYRGKPKQKLTLNVFWDAKTISLDGKSQVSSQAQKVVADAQGLGNWKVMVRGYPAGKVRANVHDQAGKASAMSAVYEMPWLY